MYDLEPRKVTGTVKYVGKVDSEYVDNRIYVGVRLDDPGELEGITQSPCEVECLHQVTLLRSGEVQCVVC